MLACAPVPDKVELIPPAETVSTPPKVPVPATYKFLGLVAPDAPMS